MRFSFIAILIAAAVLAGCNQEPQYRTVGYAAPDEPLGPQGQVYQDDQGIVDLSEPGVVGPQPESYDTAPASNIGVSTAEQRRRELEQIEGRSSVALTPSQGGYQPPATPPPAGGVFEYTVVKGDTLWGIAKRHLGSGKRWQEIQALNPGVNPAKLMPGQKLLLPAN